MDNSGSQAWLSAYVNLTSKASLVIWIVCMLGIFRDTNFRWALIFTWLKAISGQSGIFLRLLSISPAESSQTRKNSTFTAKFRRVKNSLKITFITLKFYTNFHSRNCLHDLCSIVYVLGIFICRFSVSGRIRTILLIYLESEASYCDPERNFDYKFFDNMILLVWHLLSKSELDLI